MRDPNRQIQCWIFQTTMHNIFSLGAWLLERSWSLGGLFFFYSWKSMIYFSGSILDYCAVWCFSLLPYMGCIHISIYIYIYKIDMVSSQIGNVFCCQVHGSLSGTEERCCGQILPRAPFPRTVALCAGRMPRLALIGSITYICIVYTYIYI